MVLCLIALPIFALLGVFSIKYRKLAKDSLNCLFKTVTLRRCESGLDDRIKAGITGKLLKFSPKAAGLFYRHYKLISFLILALFIWSAVEGGIGVVNYVKYGNCNGPDSSGFCILDPTGHYSGVSEVGSFLKPEQTVCPQPEADDPTFGNEYADLTIIEFGCYVCTYTKDAEPVVKEILKEYDGKVNLQFKSVVIPDHLNSYTAALAANCFQEQEKYPEFHDAVFELEKVTPNALTSLAESKGLNMTQYDECMDHEKYKEEVEADTRAGINAGIEGTPTFFIGTQKIVGPKPLKTFKAVIDKELK
ncbi:DsbA family protein [Candidatus Woesearchaeota archaeon]|nr:DsbA family protein [Candidatus Woesearchaeota archaeon]